MTTKAAAKTENLRVIDASCEITSFVNTFEDFSRHFHDKAQFTSLFGARARNTSRGGLSIHRPTTRTAAGQRRAESFDPVLMCFAQPKQRAGFQEQQAIGTRSHRPAVNCLPDEAQESEFEGTSPWISDARVGPTRGNFSVPAAMAAIETEPTTVAKVSDAHEPSTPRRRV